MTNTDLASSYLTKARKRLKVLDVLFAEEDYSDVVRESQEIVELTQKALLRRAGIDPPKWHDVGGIILENIDFIPTEEYTARDARGCITDAQFLVDLGSKIV